MLPKADDGVPTQTSDTSASRTASRGSVVAWSRSLATPFATSASRPGSTTGLEPREIIFTLVLSGRHPTPHVRYPPDMPQSPCPHSRVRTGQPSSPSTPAAQRSNRPPGHRRIGLARAPSGQDGGDRPDDYGEVGQQGPVVHVVEVEVGVLLERSVGAPAHLPQPGNAGFDRQSLMELG